MILSHQGHRVDEILDLAQTGLMRYVRQYTSNISWTKINIVDLIIELSTGVGEGGGHFPYLGMVRRFRGDDPLFYFQSDWVPILYLNTMRLNPSFC